MNRMNKMKIMKNGCMVVVMRVVFQKMTTMKRKKKSSPQEAMTA